MTGRASRSRTLSSGSGLEPFRIALPQVSLDHTLVAQHNLWLAFRQHLAEIQNDRSGADADDSDSDSDNSDA